ncbi:von Willebrand factor A domain-containing protein 8 [Lamellibrachia satsuma]|nr:von Willebrand factor A domain-containing protein 8 [Lamellibrachia satsuma]
MQKQSTCCKNQLGSSSSDEDDMNAKVGRHKSTTTKDTQEVVTIGDVSMRLGRPKHPELVPVKYLPDPIPQTLVKQLRWIMQKDLLGQDVFLIGPPGPLRRTITMMYLELTRKEVEYVSLSRDTTEMDLKQRREIRSNSAFHIDQAAVKAALEGRVLVLEGIEKAERNVLPVLNNLLENREMQLDDGRFLMAADRYDKLLKDHSQEELDAWKLVRVSEDFRVIALGLPVPRYQGNPLDPPLRSRFQAMNVDPLPFKDHLEVLNAIAHGVSPDRLSQILSFALTLKSDEAKTLGLPDFPLDNLHAIIKILTAVPSVSTQRLLQRLYPYDVMLGKEGQTAVMDALKSFDLLEDDTNYVGCLVTEVRLTRDNQATVQVRHGRHTHELHLAAGTLHPAGLTNGHYVNTHYHDQLLTDMMESHMAKDFCVIGPPGCGKSVIARQFAELLGYHLEPIMLYQDMGARDLLQQRITRPNGDTAWQPSPLVKAALDGSLAVLDGVHRINPGTFAVLHRLIHDRELSLFDGTRLLRHDRYDKIKEENKLTDEDMTNRAPVAGSSNQQWLNSGAANDVSVPQHAVAVLDRGTQRHP